MWLQDSAAVDRTGRDQSQALGKRTLEVTVGAQPGDHRSMGAGGKPWVIGRERVLCPHEMSEERMPVSDAVVEHADRLRITYVDREVFRCGAHPVGGLDEWRRRSAYPLNHREV